MSLHDIRLCVLNDFIIALMYFSQSFSTNGIRNILILKSFKHILCYEQTHPIKTFFKIGKMHANQHFCLFQQIPGLFGENLSADISQPADVLINLPAGRKCIWRSYL